ncbi:MAG: SCP2 sterol-binding domain-containing protein [Promethearchaeota archaeon]
METEKKEGQSDAKDTISVKSKEKGKKRRLKGFARTLNGMLSPLNSSDGFKSEFQGKKMRFLLVATDYPPAALININDGTLTIESVTFDDIKKTKFDGLLKATLEQIMKIATGKLNTITAWITGKIKIKGAFKLLKLKRAFKYVGNKN